MSLRWLTVFLDFPAASLESGVAFWQEVTGSERSGSTARAQYQGHQ